MPTMYLFIRESNTVNRGNSGGGGGGGGGSSSNGLSASLRPGSRTVAH